MPEGLVKISQQLYESILPRELLSTRAPPLRITLTPVPPLAVVRTQVESQIKVRDLSRASVSVTPSDYANWSAARSDLMVEAKRPLKAQLTVEVAAAPSEIEANKIRAKYEAKEKSLENEIDYAPLEMHMELELQYNFLSK